MIGMSLVQTIPIVFVVGSDPVAAGLVANLNRPEGNLTGARFEFVIKLENVHVFGFVLPGQQLYVVTSTTVDLAFRFKRTRLIRFVIVDTSSKRVNFDSDARCLLRRSVRFSPAFMPSFAFSELGFLD
jgi:hypothetical protein